MKSIVRLQPPTPYDLIIPQIDSLVAKDMQRVGAIVNAATFLIGRVATDTNVRGADVPPALNRKEPVAHHAPQSTRLLVGKPCRRTSDVAGSSSRWRQPPHS